MKPNGDQDTDLDYLLDRVPLSATILDPETCDTPKFDLEDELHQVVAMADDGTEHLVVRNVYFTHSPSVSHGKLLAIYSRLLKITRERVRQCFRAVSDRAMLRVERNDLPALRLIRQMVLRRQAVTTSTIAGAVECIENDYNWAAIAYLLGLEYTSFPVPMIVRPHVRIDDRTKANHQVVSLDKISISVGRDALLGIIDVVEWDGKQWVLPVRTFSRVEVRLIRILGVTKHRQMDLAQFYAIATANTDSLRTVPLKILSELLTRCQSKLGFWEKTGLSVPLNRPYRFHDGRLMENAPGALEPWLTAKDLTIRHVFGSDTALRVKEAARRLGISPHTTQNLFYTGHGCYIESGTIFRHAGELEAGELIDVGSIPPITIEDELPANATPVDEAIFGVGAEVARKTKSATTTGLIVKGRDLKRLTHSRLVPAGAIAIVETEGKVEIAVDHGHYISPDERFETNDGARLRLSQVRGLVLGDLESDSIPSTLSRNEVMFLKQCRSVGCKAVQPLEVDGVAVQNTLALSPRQEAQAVIARLEWLRRKRFELPDVNGLLLRRLDNLITSETQRAKMLDLISINAVRPNR